MIEVVVVVVVEDDDIDDDDIDDDDDDDVNVIDEKKFGCRLHIFHNRIATCGFPSEIARDMSVE
jgi:hypothetical protein